MGKPLNEEILELDKELKEIKKQLYIDIITEGVDDPGILKCVFMAGGPGSGKSYIAKEIFGVGKKTLASVSSGGLKIVNSDTAFENLLQKNGVNKKDLDKWAKIPELWDVIAGETNPKSLRNWAKNITKKQQAFYEAGRFGMIID